MISPTVRSPGNYIHEYGQHLSDRKQYFKHILDSQGHLNGQGEQLDSLALSYFVKRGYPQAVLRWSC